VPVDLIAENVDADAMQRDTLDIGRALVLALLKWEGEGMPAYIGLYKYTSQGVGSIKDSPSRIKQVEQVAKKLGIRMVGIWVTMGESDLVAVWEAPDDQAMAAFTLSVASNGNVTTQTMRAFSEEEFAQIVGRLS
jgi:uncharacterized protein with GYD domain